MWGNIMGASGKLFAAALLLLGFGIHSQEAQAQCTTPACQQQPQPRSTGGSSGGGGVGVQIDVGDAAKAIGGLFKKKKKPVQPPVVTTPTPTDPQKPEVVFVRSDPVVQALPRTVQKPAVKTAAVAQPKPQPVVRKPVARKIAAPIVAATVIAEPLFEPEAAAEPVLPEAVPAPVAEPVVEIPQPTAIAAPAQAPARGTNLYWIIAAAVAALATAGAAAKFIFTPTIVMDCTLADGTSRMVSNTSLSAPEVSFTVAIPGFAASTPDNFSIVA